MANKKIEEMTDDELEAKIKFNRDTTSLWRSVFVVGTASLAFVGALIVTGVVLPLVLPIASIALCWGMIMGIYRQPDLRGDAKDFATEKTRRETVMQLVNKNVLSPQSAISAVPGLRSRFNAVSPQPAKTVPAPVAQMAPSAPSDGSPKRLFEFRKA
jgi:hypothetical protein